MATRIKEWFIPYTWWDGIEITDNHVINVLLRAANNLIHVNEDRELYVDLQLPAGIAPDDDFPVGVTTGEILAEDWWQQSGTIINSKTTSWDYVRLIYANDWNLYYDPWTWVWIMIGTATAIDVNTKTFFLTGTTWATNLATAQAAMDWYFAWKNPLLMYNNKCYTMVNYYRNEQEASPYIFATSAEWETTSVLQLIVLDWTTTVTDIYESTTTNYSSVTRTFLMWAGTWNTVKRVAQKVLERYLRNDEENYNNKYNPIILSTDANGNGKFTYHLTWAYQGELRFSSLIVTDEAPSDYFMETIIIYYSNQTVSSVQRNEYWLGQYSAWSWIVIDNVNHEISANIQWALVYKWNVADVASLPSSWNTVWDVYYVEADGLMYAWDGTAWKAVGNTQIDLSNYFNVTTNTTDDIAQGSTNLFVTQAMINSWNWKQWALTAGSNIEINNWVISATDTTYSAGTGIWITGTTINNTAPFSPENAGSVWQVLKRTSTGVRWSNEFFENVFVTQAEYDALPSSKLTDWKTYFIYS